MEYMPSAASLAAAHKGKFKNLRLLTLRDNHVDPRSCMLRLEKDALEYDKSNKENIGIQGVFPVGNEISMHDIHIHFHSGGHLDTYQELGHPYVQDDGVGKTFTWVLCMSPLMARVMAESDFIELDATFKASFELDYLINIVTFNYTTFQCMFWHMYTR